VEVGACTLCSLAACLVRVQLRSKPDEEEKEEWEGGKTYMLMVSVPFLGERRMGREGRREGGRKREVYVGLYLCYTVVKKEKGESEKRIKKNPQFRKVDKHTGNAFIKEDSNPFFP